MYNDENDYELLYLIKEENEDAKEVFFEKYRPLVEMKANKFYSMYKNNGYELNDLIQEGMLALNSAIKDYEHEKDVKFNTFANVCIDRQLLSYIRDFNRQKHQVLNSSVSIDAEDKYIDEKGAFDISKCDLIAYANGGYYPLGEKLGKFGFSVQKKK